MNERNEEIDTSVFGERTRTEAEAIIARYPESRSALLPMLHLVQSEQGYVSGSGIHFCAEQLGISVAEVSAVATFYTMYKRSPCGQHLVSVCTNTMCAAMGGEAVYRALSEHLGVGHEGTAGEPGAEGSITLEHAECLAACDFAPMLQVNYEYYDNQSPEQALELVKALQRGEKPAPTRGPALSDFRGAERQLAGFFDDLDETVTGPSQATETLRGAQLAEERGWTAPSMPDDAELPPVPDRK
ncbi:NADH-quinone oxidoreductase subunit NuoE [Saccharopolyspora griseoalba]|uniref:NADH-quinone oxidoreductase subunit NuoE n=1 Tax=Saccharopolyspora griseoalba TaxID=1431848 RepID=A0ABW2LJT1_9PSEU